MLKYTKAVLNDAVKDLKSFLYWFSVITQLLYIGYLLFAIISGIGIIYVNVALGVISLAYFIFYMLTNNATDKKTKHVAYVTRHTKTIIKLVLNAFTLAVAIYGIYISATTTNAFSLMLTILMIVFWCVQLVLEIIIFFFEHKKNMVLYGLQKDLEPWTNAVNKVGNVVRMVTGKERVEKDPLPSSVENYLDKVLIKYKEQKDNK